MAVPVLTTSSVQPPLAGDTVAMNLEYIDNSESTLSAYTIALNTTNSELIPSAMSLVRLKHPSALLV